ncbi:MAG: hypothetical protein H7Y37_08780 [Anaerolineae bacterium]|nr:hypothetical protein [Gloeobacterales cyanobacterium ES-bin-313]
MNTNPRYEGIEYEIRKEQTNTLGIAGKQLQSALEEYEAFISMGNAEDSLRAEQLLDGISQKVYALLLQREFIGFHYNNLEWIQTSFSLPPGVMKRIGASSQPSR